MNLIIDLGNTSAKIAHFEGDTLEQVKVYPKFENDIISKDFDVPSVENCILSSVINHSVEVAEFVKSCKKGFFLAPDLNLPFNVDYQSKETLGMDRLANAAALHSIYLGENSLCVDIGTCIKFDFVNREGSYKGGSIGPGLAMRYKALNTFTDKLPLIELQTSNRLIGNNTETSITSGVYNGMLAEINGMIDRYLELYPDTKICLTGGDASFFENEVKNTIFADAFFTLRGINAILNANAY